MMRLAPFVLAVPLALGGCGAADSDPAPAGVTVGEARALDEAAAMIEQRRLPADTVGDTGDQAPATPPETASPAAPDAPR